MRRTKQIAKRFSRETVGLMPSNLIFNLVPPKAIIEKKGRDKIIPIKAPKYVSPEDLSKDSMHTFVEITSQENVSWLQSFSEHILGLEKDKSYPLLNPELDFTNPEISGLRIYVEDIGFVHIQVSRIPGTNSMFQLDYFENTETGVSNVLLVVVVDISEKDFESINLIFASPTLELIDETQSRAQNNIEYARRIALIFRYVQVYMRIWDYEYSSGQCEIIPLEYFGKKIDFSKS